MTKVAKINRIDPHHNRISPIVKYPVIFLIKDLLKKAFIDTSSKA